MGIAKDGPFWRDYLWTSARLERRIAERLRREGDKEKATYFMKLAKDHEREYEETK